MRQLIIKAQIIADYHGTESGTEVRNLIETINTILQGSGIDSQPQIILQDYPAREAITVTKGEEEE